MLEREKLEEAQGLIVQKCARVLDTRPFYNVTGDLQELVDLITMIAAHQAAKAVYEMEDRRNTIQPPTVRPHSCALCDQPFEDGDLIQERVGVVFAHAHCPGKERTQ